MRELTFKKTIRQDLRKMQSKPKILTKVFATIDTLAKTGKLHRKYKAHKLKGEWLGKMECHVQGDWLLIYVVTKTHVTLYRTGTHSELF